MGHELRVSSCHNYTTLAAWEHLIQSRFPASWRLLPALGAPEGGWRRSGGRGVVAAPIDRHAGTRRRPGA